MFTCGQKVVYGIHGVCSILDTEIRMIDRKKVEYFVLEPVNQPGTRFYIPTQNQAALAKLQPLLTPDALDRLLKSEDASKDVWISDENHRKQRYRELINSGDRAALICMVRMLRKHKSMQIESGKKFHLCDENFLRDAEKLLSAEFALVLDIPVSEVGAYIESKIG